MVHHGDVLVEFQGSDHCPPLPGALALPAVLAQVEVAADRVAGLKCGLTAFADH